MKKKGICSKCGAKSEWFYCNECRSKYNAENHIKNRNKIRNRKKELFKEQYKNDNYRKKRIDWATSWYQKNKVRVLELARIRTKEKQDLIFEKYGNKCMCCGEEERKFLTLDHVNNDGARHREEIGFSRTDLYSWIIKNNFPNKIQILCYNCNCSKGVWGECPHKK